jgi:hypothetical protein
MHTLSNILFWLGILGLIDGSLGILFQEKWKRVVGELDIQRLALIEIVIALVLLGAHYLIGLNMD